MTQDTTCNAQELSSWKVKMWKREVSVQSKSELNLKTFECLEKHQSARLLVGYKPYRRFESCCEVLFYKKKLQMPTSQLFVSECFLYVFSNICHPDYYFSKLSQFSSYSCKPRQHGLLFTSKACELTNRLFISNWYRLIKLNVHFSNSVFYRHHNQQEAAQAPFVVFLFIES